MDAEQLKTYFERCYCVSLDRENKWDSCSARLRAADWPLADVERFRALDGQNITPPQYWRQGRGAYCCFASHRTLIERALSDNVRSLLLLEDDALPCEGFATKVASFLSAVPSDWGMIYLGGQHLNQQQRPPKRVNDHVLRATNINRTHAFAMSRSGMEAVYSHLMRRDWNPRHHIDHRLGVLHESEKVPVYTPVEWLIGQAAGHSAVCGQQLGDRFWNGHLGNIDERTGARMVAVVGPFRSGTSCVAGLLHTLGVSMGDRLRPPGPGNPNGFYEAVMLGQLCRAMYQEPQMRSLAASQVKIDRLSRWLRSRKSPGKVLGAKHPSLCMMVPEMIAAWPDCRFVVLDRPVEESVESLARVGWKGWTREASARATQLLISQRDADIARHSPPHLRLTWSEVKSDPSATVAKLVAFCGITPSAEQVAAAIAQVQP